MEVVPPPTGGVVASTVAVFHIDDFRKGKKSRQGEPLPPDEMPEPQAVVAVTPEEIDAYLGVRDARHRTKRLRGLRDLGALVHEPDRLTQRVRLRDGRKVRCYVLRPGVDRAAPPPRPVATW